MKQLKIIIILFSFLVSACTGFAQKKVKAPIGMNPGKLPVIVYKTKKDYRHNVPVFLSDDKSTIVSYPDPKDIKMGGKKLQPVALHKGYMLDKRGINKNVAFLNMTYDQYAALPSAPGTDELYKMILEKNPLTDMCNCGMKKDYPDPVTAINALIDAKKLKSTCKSLK